MESGDKKQRGRPPLGDLTNQSSKEVKRQRDQARSAAMTDEQREEKNKRRRDAYMRTKAASSNKENIPAQDTDASYTLQVDDLGERTLSLQRIDGVTTQGEGELNSSVLINETATPGLAGEFQSFRLQAAAAMGQNIRGSKKQFR